MIELSEGDDSMNDRAGNAAGNKETIEKLENTITQARRCLSALKSRCERNMAARSGLPVLTEEEKKALDLVQISLADLKWQLRQEGKDYIPSQVEERSIEFNERLNRALEVEFETEDFFSGSRRWIFQLESDQVTALYEPPRIESRTTVLPYSLSRDDFIQTLQALDLMDWRKRYGKNRFRFETMTDVQSWTLTIRFPRTRPYIVRGVNSCPWNFEQFLDLIRFERPAQVIDYDQIAADWRRDHPHEQREDDLVWIETNF